MPFDLSAVLRRSLRFELTPSVSSHETAADPSSRALLRQVCPTCCTRIFFIRKHTRDFAREERQVQPSRCVKRCRPHPFGRRSGVPAHDHLPEMELVLMLIRLIIVLV